MKELEMAKTVKTTKERLDMSEAAKQAGFPEKFVKKIAGSNWVEFFEEELLQEATNLCREKMPKFLALLAKGLPGNRKLAACCRLASSETLTQLASDSDGEVRALVAQNINSPNSALKILASGLDADVLYLVATNLMAEEDTLSRILRCPICREDKEKNYGVFVAIAQHPNATWAMREELAGFKCDLIRDAVAGNPMTEPKILERLISKNAFAVSDNPGAPIAILEKIFPVALEEWEKDDNPTLLCNLANNPNASVGLLDRLAKLALTGPGTVCLEVCKNPKTSAGTLQFIAENCGGFNDNEIKGVAIRHQNISDEALRIFYEQDGEQALRVILLRKAQKRNKK